MLFSIEEGLVDPFSPSEHVILMKVSRQHICNRWKAGGNSLWVVLLFYWIYFPWLYPKYLHGAPKLLSACKGPGSLRDVSGKSTKPFKGIVIIIVNIQDMVCCAIYDIRETWLSWCTRFYRISICYKHKYFCILH